MLRGILRQDSGFRWLSLWPCSHQQQVHFKRLLGDEPAIQRPQPPGSDQVQPRVSATQVKIYEQNLTTDNVSIAPVCRLCYLTQDWN